MAARPALRAGRWRSSVVGRSIAPGLRPAGRQRVFLQRDLAPQLGQVASVDSYSARICDISKSEMTPPRSRLEQVDVLLAPGDVSSLIRSR
jgi:hypothetical protein